MMLYLKLIHYIFIYSIYRNKWVIVESSETTTNPNPGTGTQEGTSVTTPAAGGNNSSTKTGVELSLKATDATDQFEYNKVGNIVTFTAKDNYAFKSVKTGKNGDIVVWSTDNASEYATKVVLYGKGKKEKIVTIHMSNNSTKSYKKDGKNKPWNEYTGPLPSSGQSGTSKELKPEEYPKEIKLFKADSNDATKSVEINTSEYKVKKDGDDHIYEFNDGVECTLVKRDDKEVWKHDSSKHSGKYPKSLTYNNKDFKIILIFTDLRIVCEKDGDSYKATEDNTKTATVDITKPFGDGYISDPSGSITYLPRAGYFFKAVKEDSKEIWKTDKKDEYSKKVKADFMKNIVTVYIGTDGKSTKVYKKGSDGNWKEEGQDSTKKSTTDGSGGTDQSGGGGTQTSPTSGGGKTGTGGGGGGGTTPASKTGGGGTTGTDGSGGTDQSGGGTTGTGGSGGGATPASPKSG